MEFIVDGNCLYLGIYLLESAQKTVFKNKSTKLYLLRDICFIKNSTFRLCILEIKNPLLVETQKSDSHTTNNMCDISL